MCDGDLWNGLTWYRGEPLKCGYESSRTPNSGEFPEGCEPLNFSRRNLLQAVAPLYNDCLEIWDP
jgi:hypothetical protein